MSPRTPGGPVRFAFIPLLLVACGGDKDADDDGTIPDDATDGDADTGPAACDDWTCDDPSAELQGSFESELASTCAFLDPEGIDAYRCETPGGAPYDVITTGTFEVGLETWWFDAATDDLVARSFGADDAIYCCDTTDTYTWGVAPTDCARVSDYACPD